MDSLPGVMHLARVKEKLFITLPFCEHTFCLKFNLPIFLFVNFLFSLLVEKCVLISAGLPGLWFNCVELFALPGVFEFSI